MIHHCFPERSELQSLAFLGECVLEDSLSPYPVFCSQLKRKPGTRSLLSVPLRPQVTAVSAHDAWDRLAVATSYHATSEGGLKKKIAAMQGPRHHRIKP